METDQELIDGFLSRNPEAETRLVEQVQRWMRARVRTRYPHLWWQMDDLQQNALLRLCEMREDPQQVGLIRPPVWELVKFLMVAPTRKAERVKRWVPLKRKHEPPVAQSQDDAVTVKEMLEIAESLPRGMAKTMLAQEASVAGEGPALEEALGTDRRTARRRLARAQEAVIKIATGENVEIREEDQDD